MKTHNLMDPYSCYYCEESFLSQKDTLEHTIVHHRTRELKLKKIELSPSTGHYGHRTINFNLIPCEVEANGSKVCVKDNGSISTKALVLKSPSTASPLQKKSKQDTITSQPCKQKLFEGFACSEDSIVDCIDKLGVSDYDDHNEVEMTSDDDDDFRSMSEMLPEVISFLKENEQLETIKQFFNLIKNKHFPPNQISYLLFLDVVKLLSSDNVRQMRYSNDIKQFWHIGSKLFHGKFLRFMSGEKSTATFLKGASTQFNFAVPSRSILQSNQLYRSNEMKPGLLPHMLEMFSENDRLKSFKLCVDGKKLNMSSKSLLGGVDLFGFEEKPTAKDRSDRLCNEEAIVSQINSVMKKFYDMDITTLNLSLSKFPNDCKTLLQLMKDVLAVLSYRICDLRQMKVKKSIALRKLKEISGPNWRNCRYAFAISAIHTSLFQIDETLDDCLKAIDDIGLACSLVQNSDTLFATGDNLHMQTQCNHVCLSGVEEILTENDNLQDYSCVIRQRSDNWFKLRSSGKVTGSTIHRALGLDSLKNQNAYIDCRFYGKLDHSPAAIDSVRMKYGSENEINAVSTLIGKILPVHFPEMSFFEEGCYMIKHKDESFLVVSPDGSCRGQDGNILACEFKCPYPDKLYSTQVQYKIPKYYACQLLAEMYSLSADKLIYLSYTKESSTAFLVEFDSGLWQEILEELTRIYGVEKPKKQSRLSSAAKAIKQKISVFLDEKVTFLGEVKSVDAVRCSHPIPMSKGQPREFHKENNFLRRKTVKLNSIQTTFERVQKLVFESEHLTKLIASEILVFMLSDVDRIYKPDVPHAMPIAYGLKGYSLKTESLRNMIEHVVDACNASGLHVPVISFDGQWARIAMRDENGNPLTLLQLQKDVQVEAKKMSKAEQIKALMETNRISNVKNIDDLRSVVNMDVIYQERKRDDGIENITVLFNIWNLKANSKFDVPKTAVRFLRTKKTCNENRDNTVENNDDYQDGNAQVDYILQTIPQDQQVNIDASCMNALNSIKSNMDSVSSLPPNTDAELDETSDVAIHLLCDGVITEETGTGENQIHDVRLEYSANYFESAVAELKGNEHTKRERYWSTLTVQVLQEKLQTANLIYKSFLADEIIRLIFLFSDGKEQLRKTTRKCDLTDKLCSFLNINTMTDFPKRKQATPPSLRNLCKRVISTKVSKDYLNVIFATNLFPVRLEQHHKSAIFTRTIKVKDLNEPDFWYSQPLKMKNGQITFPILDNEHLLVNTRVKCCSSGMKQAGISNNAWLKVAKEGKTNRAGLTMAHVEDLIDKQSCAFALKTFSEEVESVMRANDDVKEADFTRLIREWYEAEDKPGLSPYDRIQRRLNLRSWLLQDVDFCCFPAPGSHVKGIPIVLYEGFLTNIERHLQLYPFVKENAYNARAIGTLDIENFFGEFTELDPKGNGILRPEDVPVAMATACEILHTRMDTVRCFSMRTSCARPYPVKDLEMADKQFEEFSEKQQTCNVELPMAIIPSASKVRIAI